MCYVGLLCLSFIMLFYFGVNAPIDPSLPNIGTFKMYIGVSRIYIIVHPFYCVGEHL